MTIFFHSLDLQLYRKRRKGVSNRYGMSATLTVLEADVQPLDAERLAMVPDGKFGATYQCFIDPSIDVKEGDQAVDTATNKRYSVKGVSTWDGAGLLSHKEIILVSLDG